MRRVHLAFLIVLLITPFSYSQDVSPGFPEVRGAYLGQEPPDTIPDVFAEGVLNEFSMINGRLVFSPDGKDIQSDRHIRIPPCRRQVHGACEVGARSKLRLP